MKMLNIKDVLKKVATVVSDPRFKAATSVVVAVVCALNAYRRVRSARENKDDE